MAQYQLKHAFWSLGDQYEVKDAHGRPVLRIAGKVFSWGDSLSVQDTAGVELARIEQQLLTFKPRYRILRGGALFAEVVKEWSWFSKTFTLDVPGPNDYTITGSFWDHEYRFVRGGREVARVSKSFWPWSDTYGVDAVDGEDHQTILCTCVVIDLVCHDEQD